MASKRTKAIGRRAARTSTRVAPARRSEITAVRSFAATALVAASVLILAPRPAAAATTTTVKAPGAVVSRTDDGASTTLVVKATVARLDLWCSGGRLVVNRSTTGISCSRLARVTTTGLTGDDVVTINATGFGSGRPAPSLTVKTGAGNDTVTVRHHLALTIWAGIGNDVVGAALGAGATPTSEVLYGEDGADRLTNLGFVGIAPIPYDASSPGPAGAVRSKLRGGPGADRLVGDPTRWTDATLDPGDATSFVDGPATFAPEHTVGAAPAWTYDRAAGNPYDADALRLGTDRTVALGCTTGTAPRATVDALALPVRCAAPLVVWGTAGADVVTYDQQTAVSNRYGLDLTVWLGAGDDVATVRHPLGGGVTIGGGDGADRLTSGTYLMQNAEGADGSSLLGDAGDDVLTNLGFLGTAPILDLDGPPEAYDHQTILSGGPGADRLQGAATRVDAFWFDAQDTMTDPGGPARYRATGTLGADAATVDLRASGGTLRLTSPSGDRTVALGPLAWSVDIDLLGGDDTAAIRGASSHTSTAAVGGAGTDALTIAPAATPAILRAPPWTFLDQPGAAPIGFDDSFERVAISPAG